MFQLLGYFFPHLSSYAVDSCVECCLCVEWEGFPVSENERKRERESVCVIVRE